MYIYIYLSQKDLNKKQTTTNNCIKFLYKTNNFTIAYYFTIDNVIVMLIFLFCFV